MPLLVFIEHLDLTNGPTSMALSFDGVSYVVFYFCRRAHKLMRRTEMTAISKMAS